MKLEQPELPLLFSETVVPDIFFAEYLSQMPGNCVKVYLYMIFLSKFGKDIKLNDLSKKLALPLKDINDAIANQVVRMEIRTEDNKLVQIENIQTNTDYNRLTYNKLTAKTKYIITF